MSNKEKLEELIKELSDIQEDSERRNVEYSDAWWESLSIQEQQLAFFTVIRKMYQYRVIEGRSYRGTLYDGFGWGPEAYGMGMSCNFFDLHNMICDAEYADEVIEQLAIALQKQGLDLANDPRWYKAVIDVRGG